MYKRFFLPFICLFFQICCCQKNQVTLYDQPDQQGNSVTLSMSSNLAWNNFDNKAVSVCVSGLMLFYTDTDFSGYMEYVYGGENHCTNLTHRAGKVSSIRYPGFLEDIKKDSITLYDSGFGGTDYREYGDAFNGGYRFSLIVTGGSNWTVFDDHNFQGNSACLMVPDPEKRTPCFLSRVQEIPNFGYAIKSGKKGCDDTSLIKVHLVSFAKPETTNTNRGKSKSQNKKTTETPTQLKPYTEGLNHTAIIDPLLHLVRSNNNSLLAKHSEKGNDTIISVTGSATISEGGNKLIYDLAGLFFLCLLCGAVSRCMPAKRKETFGC